MNIFVFALNKMKLIRSTEYLPAGKGMEIKKFLCGFAETGEELELERERELELELELELEKVRSTEY